MGVRLLPARVRLFRGTQKGGWSLFPTMPSVRMRPTEREVDPIVRSNIQLSHILWHFCARRGIKMT